MFMLLYMKLLKYAMLWGNYFPIFWGVCKEISIVYFKCFHVVYVLICNLLIGACVPGVNLSLVEHVSR